MLEAGVSPPQESEASQHNGFDVWIECANIPHKALEGASLTRA
jgi:hypothetical protein